jgi:hypothetical protein
MYINLHAQINQSFLGGFDADVYDADVLLSDTVHTRPLRDFT